MRGIHATALSGRFCRRLRRRSGRRRYWRYGNRSFAENLLYKAGRKVCRQDSAIVSLFHFQTVEELLHIVVGSLGGSATLGSVKDVKERADLIVDALSVVGEVRKSLGTQVQCGQVAGRGNHDGIVGKQQ